MPTTKITTEIAYSARVERGLMLPKTTERGYVNERVGQIADRQAELLNELNSLDDELKEIAKSEGLVV